MPESGRLLFGGLDSRIGFPRDGAEKPTMTGVQQLATPHR